VVLTETTSNVHHPTFINTIDTLITLFTNEEFEDFREILVTFGGMIVSKRIKAFLRKYKQNTTGISTRWGDTFNALTKHFEVEPMYSMLLPLTSVRASDYKS
jgi:2-succinyl-5-enolpyruvyl-6-hydroxy-3-cyclohexene-1-carboxylate synthase